MESQSEDCRDYGVHRFHLVDAKPNQMTSQTGSEVSYLSQTQNLMPRAFEHTDSVPFLAVEGTNALAALGASSVVP